MGGRGGREQMLLVMWAILGSLDYSLHVMGSHCRVSSGGVPGLTYKKIILALRCSPIQPFRPCQRFPRKCDSL